MARALVTGAAEGAGAALALALAARGHALALPAEAQATAAAARALGARVTLLPEGVNLVDAASAAFGGPLDLLILGAACEAEPADWAAPLGPGLAEPAALLQAFAAQAPEPLSVGRDLQTRALALLVLVARDLSPMAAPGAAMVAQGRLALCRAAAQTLAPRLRVNAIGLGAARPDPAPNHAAWGPAQPISTSSDADAEVAAALAYMLDSVAVTGQFLCLGNEVFPA